MGASAPPPPSPFFNPRRVSSHGGVAPRSKSPFLQPRRRRSHGGVAPSTATPDLASVPVDRPAVAPEHKSTLLGCAANLITATVGAGIVGIPYALRETGLVAGVALLALYGVLGCKSLCLLVETAKHVDAASYEVLAEAAFGRRGFVALSVLMFVMSWGPMLSYLMLVKDNLGVLTGYGGERCLVAASAGVMLPLCLQRDMADLARTSRISVVFNVAMVLIVAWAAPTSQSIADAGGLPALLAESTWHPATCFTGLGVVSFAFSCQHSALIIAGSCENPTRARWTRVSRFSFLCVFVLSVVMGGFGYVGFLEESRGNILRNFANDSRAANAARGLLCSTMFFVFPLESFVARHVIMTNLFSGRQAHEGDDHAVLDRMDRRVVVTVMLYLSVLLPALRFDDVGIVLAWTGTVAATSLSFIGPGILFIGVHGEAFLGRAWRPGVLHDILWYCCLMPLWNCVATTGARGLGAHYARREAATPADEFRLGRVKHRRDLIRKQQERRARESVASGCEAETEALHAAVGNGNEKTAAELGLITVTPENNQGYGATASAESHEPAVEAAEADPEEDPQDEPPTAWDFAVAIAFVYFGVIAFTAGVYSIVQGD